MKPLLMVDCYQDGASAAPNFLRYLNRPAAVVRAVSDPIPKDLRAYSGMVISGSSASVLDPPFWIPPLQTLVEQAANEHIPVLGVCFGHQLLAHALVGDQTVRLAPRAEVGWVDIEVMKPDPIFQSLESGFRTFVSHADEVAATGPGMTVLARSALCENHAFRMDDLPIWGVQFHSEMDYAENEVIVVGRARRHPELQIVPKKLLADYVDSTPIAQTLFGNFVDQLEGPDDR